MSCSWAAHLVGMMGIGDMGVWPLLACGSNSVTTTSTSRLDLEPGKGNGERDIGRRSCMADVCYHVAYQS